MEIGELRVLDSKPLTPYLACAICEGFGEGEDATDRDRLTAWSYIGKAGLYKTLQGFYGRTLQNLLDNGVLDSNYDITEYGLEVTHN